MQLNQRMMNLLGVSLVITIPGVIYLWKKFRNRSSKPKESNDSDEINECVFFSPQLKECRSRISSKQTSCGLIACNYCSYNKIIGYIRETRHHLDVCQYNLTVEELCIMIIQLFKKGVFVRIITDKQMSEEAAGVKVLCFRKEYIPIKVIRSSMIMHNKFVIIDNSIVITGSSNWTRQGMDGNLENVIITNNRDITARYMQYFEYIWENDKEFSRF